MTILKLYFLFAKIGLFTFGGGYAMIPLFQDELVVRHSFISPEDFANMVALAQITPGPVGLNAATYVGYTQMGFAGALAGTLGLMTPSLLLVTFAAAFFLYFRDSKPIRRLLSGVRPATIGLIAAAVIFFADSSIFLVDGECGTFCSQLAGTSDFCGSSVYPVEMEVESGCDVIWCRFHFPDAVYDLRNCCKVRSFFCIQRERVRFSA